MLQTFESLSGSGVATGSGAPVETINKKAAELEVQNLKKTGSQTSIATLQHA